MCYCVLAGIKKNKKEKRSNARYIRCLRGVYIRSHFHGGRDKIVRHRYVYTVIYTYSRENKKEARDWKSRVYLFIEETLIITIFGFLLFFFFSFLFLIVMRVLMHCERIIINYQGERKKKVYSKRCKKKGLSMDKLRVLARVPTNVR